MGKPMDWRRLLDITGGKVSVMDYTPTPEELERTRKGLEEYQRGLKERKSKSQENPQNKP